ncbi:MAG: hypothetical protein C0432_00350 [Candidatus Puniceispirillum sp.]|nr:hypothetical protein [Candidatus Pelagibacter sp.]MBA4282733.1 hypothetical protein [Candidatus Puniceispirillum sp.]
MFVQKSKKILLCSVCLMFSYSLFPTLGLTATSTASTEVTATQENNVATTVDSGSVTDASQNAMTDNVATIADGETYLETVRGKVKDYNHNESLSLFSESSTVAAPAGVKASTVCAQKVPAGFYLADALDPKQNGMVSVSRSALYLPMFQLNHGAKFILNVPEQTDGTGKIQNYIGLVLLRHGDGSADGDIICFSQYLAPQQSGRREFSSSVSPQVVAPNAASSSVVAKPVTATASGA